MCSDCARAVSIFRCYEFPTSFESPLRFLFFRGIKWDPIEKGALLSFSFCFSFFFLAFHLYRTRLYSFRVSFSRSPPRHLEIAVVGISGFVPSRKLQICDFSPFSLRCICVRVCVSSYLGIDCAVRRHLYVELEEEDGKIHPLPCSFFILLKRKVLPHFLVLCRLSHIGFSGTTAGKELLNFGLFVERVGR